MIYYTPPEEPLAARSTKSSRPTGPTICNPTGIPFCVLPQGTLTAGQLAVVNANAYTTAEKAKLAHYDESTNLSTLLAGKQDSLSSGQLDVCNGSVYTASEKAKVAHVDISSGLTALLNTKSNSADVYTKTQIDARTLDDVDNTATFVRMTPAERTLLGTTHANLHTSHTTQIAAKQDTLIILHRPLNVGWSVQARPWPWEIYPDAA